ncbi:ROK family protein [Candidatus Nomurabacteria bacterium]|nr:ROK family protein [Candidatus Nomurabacteria bacterium]
MYLIFDIGATKMRIAVSADGASFSEPKVLPSPEGAAELVSTFADVAQELLGGKKPKAICGGVTRKHYDARKGLAEIFDCPTYFENDAALAALGEARVGAGRGKNIVVYLTISTGVGGARVTNGRIDESANGFEPGSQILNLDNEQKTLEQLVSGRSLAKRFGKSPKEVSDPVIWDELARLLAHGLYNTAVHWSPEVIILGGSMILGDPRIDLITLEKHLRGIPSIFSDFPTIASAELGDFNGLHGALHFLQQKLSN